MRLSIRFLTSVVIAASCGGTAGLLLWLGLERAGAAGRHVDDAVLLLVIAAGVAMLSWYGLTAVITAAIFAIRSIGGRWHQGERWAHRAGAPLLRRWAAVAATTSVAVTATVPAYAGALTSYPPGLQHEQDFAIATGTTDEFAADEGTSDPDDSLDWGWQSPQDPPTEPFSMTFPNMEAELIGPRWPTSPTPTFPNMEAEIIGPQGPPTNAEPASAPDPDPEPDPEPESDDGGASDPQVYVVRPGDSLWTITATLLDSATSAEITAAWPELYEANSDVIGEDPALIVAGQQLHLPNWAVEEES